MQVVITGGCGFIGRRLALKLLEQGVLANPSGGMDEIKSLVLFDVGEPTPVIPSDPRLKIVTGDICSEADISALISPETSIVYHFAAVVSSGAEADFDLGMNVNFDGTRTVLEVCRKLETPPRLIFASSVAAYGGDMPDVIQDSTIQRPQTSYGVQKAMCELLVNDYTRKGFIDGRTLRLPTIVVRPGKPNKAASTWASSIIREPLQGQEAICPVSGNQAMWCLSPRRVVDAFVRAASLSGDEIGANRAIGISGTTYTVREMLDALVSVAGTQMLDRIRWEPDSGIQAIVSGWPTHFNPVRGMSLGFSYDKSMVEIIESFIEDELDGTFVS
ncbi:MAG: SDR family oxidoreductase [Alphaproteobacteria bacterium]|nr:SDR family oxidoreductase [Alphaproteobacteria bacterium]